VHRKILEKIHHLAKQTEFNDAAKLPSMASTNAKKSFQGHMNSLLCPLLLIIMSLINSLKLLMIATYTFTLF